MRRSPLGVWYRLRWNIHYALLTVLGPANLEGDKDPRVRLRQERRRQEERHSRDPS